jgi:DNA-binding beta-propeller fold protein YncE
MKIKWLRLRVHYRKNAPLIHTLVVVAGIFTVFQNCGRQGTPKSFTSGQPYLVPSPASSPDPSPGVSPTPIVVSSPFLPSSLSRIRFPIETDASGNRLFAPGRPFGLALDADSNVAVAAFEGPLVFCQAATGVCSKVFSETRVPAHVDVPRPNPIGVVILPDSRIAYVDHESRSLHLQVRNADTKDFTWQVTSLGFQPYGIASDESGSRVYITGEEAYGAFCQLGDSKTKTACTLSKGLAGFDVAVDRTGKVYVANANSLQICDDQASNCSYLDFPDGRTMAVGVAVGKEILVSDYFNARILRCTLERASLRCSDYIRGLNIPRAVRLDQHGNIHVAEYNSGRIIRMSPEGKQF